MRCDRLQRMREEMLTRRFQKRYHQEGEKVSQGRSGDIRHEIASETQKH